MLSITIGGSSFLGDPSVLFSLCIVTSVALTIVVTTVAELAIGTFSELFFARTR